LLQPLKKVAVINIIRHITQLLIGICIARWLGPSEKGNLFLFTTIAATTSVLLSFGYSNSIIYHCKKKIINFDRALLYLSAVAVGQILILTAIKYFMGESVSKFLFDGNENGGEFVTLLIVYSVITLINYFVNAYCLAFQYFGLYFISFALSGVVVGGVNFVGLLFWDFGLTEVLLSLIIIEVLTSIYAIFFVSTRQCKITNNKKYSVSNYALKSYLGVSGSTLSTNGDSFILASVLSSDQIGIYSIAKTFYRLLAILPQTINSFLFGIFCDLDKIKAQKLITKLFYSFSFVSVLVLLSSYYLLEYLILWLYGDAFSVAYQPAMVLIFSACIITLTSSINPFLLAFNRPLATSTVTLCSSSLSLISSVYLTSKYGILGAAYAVLIGAVCTFFMRGYFYKNERKDLNEV
jgi:O-antigen/teichoic acid export membrane protein